MRGLHFVETHWLAFVEGLNLERIYGSLRLLLITQFSLRDLDLRCVVMCGVVWCEPVVVFAHDHACLHRITSSTAKASNA